MDTTINVYSHIENSNIMDSMNELRNGKPKEEEPKPIVAETSKDDPIAIITQRYLRGEITEEEAKKMKKFVEKEMV